MDGPCPAQVAGCCSRMMWREIRKNRRLRKWESLPRLRLRPHDRPLFECRGCGFSNPFGPLCPWCCCVCQVTDTFSVKRRLRRKQLSSPSLLSEAQKAQLDRLEKRASSSGHYRTCSSGDMSTGGESLHVSSVRAGTPEKDRRKKRRYGTVYSTADLVFQAATISITHSLSQGDGATESTGEDSSIPAPSLTTSTITFDVAYTNMSAESIKTPSHCPSDVSPQRSLRRKRKMSTLRDEPSCSLRRRATAAESQHSRKTSYEINVRPQSTHTRPASAGSYGGVSDRSSSPIPLGHPLRPLYSAIRGNMTQPPTPDESLSQSRSNSPQPSVLHERLTRSLDIPRPPLRSRYDFTLSSFHPYPLVLASGATTGCSVSGEAELHMDLARCRSVDGILPEYKFHWMKRRGTMRAKLETISKGLKDLFGKV
ncbi:hypothetical protein CERSUDRAFT_119832 [Gelatoporia subvermispora B]|uniref:Uncharacterized protein n=1 Tax=Ceriporiopsis subvermispora (strain B) TaxID=914234 RepID=M2Q3A7_CERS8|nr:hypothetical protein CERSUDRAFT_119832 [Gelatoporia subvermispora B]